MSIASRKSLSRRAGNLPCHFSHGCVSRREAARHNTRCGDEFSQRALVAVGNHETFIPPRFYYGVLHPRKAAQRIHRRHLVSQTFCASTPFLKGLKQRYHSLDLTFV